MKAILESQRFLFRELQEDDLPFVAMMLADPLVMQFYPSTYAMAGAREWLDRQMRRYRSHGYGKWLLLEKSTGQPVGQVGLAPQVVDEMEETEIGYLIQKAFWRRGYATEAATAVRDYAFQKLSKDHVISLIRPVNIPSQGVAEKIGMRPDRVTMFAGLEHIVFKITRAEWTRARMAAER